MEAEKTGKSASTRESYTNTMRGFVAFLKHDDATRVTAEDVIAYKDHRLGSVGRGGKPISPQTVKNSDLAGLKSVFGWAVANRQLPVNPATGISVMKVARTQTRDKWFTDEETVRILRAALQHQQGEELPETFAAKRWVPWLMAFTGARVGELVQLRKQDLRRVELDGRPGGTWVLQLRSAAARATGRTLAARLASSSRIVSGEIRCDSIGRPSSSAGGREMRTDNLAKCAVINYGFDTRHV